MLGNAQYNSTEYPYDSTDASCTLPSGEGVSTPSNSSTVAVLSGSSSELELALAKKPVVVSIKAGTRIFRNYESGVITNCDEQSIDDSDDGSISNEDIGDNYPIDHFALVVGYGQTDAGTDYWLLQNSFGANWGEQGYVKILKETLEPEAGSNAFGVCNVLTQPVYLDWPEEKVEECPYCDYTFAGIRAAC